MRKSSFLYVPCSEYTDNVEDDACLHHVCSLDVAGAVHDGVGPRGHGQHEGVADTDGAGHHEQERVGAEGEGHLGEDRDQDVGTGGVGGHLRQEGGDEGDDEADQKGVQALVIVS